ncbi:MAG: hypothetical protein RLZZ15_706 [Verrucomicrobiota bacterium]|jgi:hypothetical protein
MALPIQVSSSSGASLDGNSSSGGNSGFSINSAFAVGRGASAGGGVPSWLWPVVVAGVAVFGLVLVFRKR